LKILHVSTSYKPSFETGGVARSCYEMTTSLAKMGHDVTVYTTDRGENRVDAKKNSPINVDGVKVYYFKNISNHIAFRSKIITPYYAPIIARKVLKKFDIIHIHEHRTLLAAIVSHYARKYDVPYVVQPRGSLKYDKGQNHLKKFFDLICGKKILNKSSKLLALTSNEKEEFLEFDIPERKIKIVPNAINPNVVPENLKKGKFRDKYDIDDNTKIILFLGRLNKIKGIDRLLKALPHLKNEDYQCIIVGPGKKDYKNELKNIVNENKLEDKVIFTGALYGKDKYKAYNDADVYVLPSRYEGFPNTALEAGLMRNPVILSDAIPLSAELNEENAGIVFNGDVEDLVKKLNFILENKTHRDALGKTMKKLIMEKYTYEKIIKQLLDTYKLIIN